uniref:Uncharacterized protein n=1 Tax=Anguilla anguilla TaxID=7936 RepID=A0A0E9UEP6_ANGAN
MVPKTVNVFSSCPELPRPVCSQTVGWDLFVVQNWVLFSFFTNWVPMAVYP